MNVENKVIETNEVSEIITNMLNKSENIYITDGVDKQKILLDDGAINLLRSHYKSKTMWGNNLNG